MKQKIALVLILVMAGSMCLYAEDYSGSDPMDNIVPIGLAIAGAGVLVMLIIAFVRIGEDDSSDWTALDTSANVKKPVPAALNNPIIKYVDMGFDGQNVFIGARFSF
jgi:hypothetical protein